MDIPENIAIVPLFLILACFMREVSPVFLVIHLRAGACKALNPSLVQLKEEKEIATSKLCLDCRRTSSAYSPLEMKCIVRMTTSCLND
jgi:hypothetical protein